LNGGRKDLHCYRSQLIFQASCRKPSEFVLTESSCAMQDAKPGEVLFEYAQIGNSMRVTAVDAATGIEATFQAPLTLSQADMQKMALRKLVYVMGKKK